MRKIPFTTTQHVIAAKPRRPTMDMVETLDEMLASFKRDPSDTDYQRGYEACLKELRRVAVELNEKASC